MRRLRFLFGVDQFLLFAQKGDLGGQWAQQPLAARRGPWDLTDRDDIVGLCWLSEGISQISGAPCHPRPNDELDRSTIQPVRSKGVARARFNIMQSISECVANSYEAMQKAAIETNNAEQLQKVDGGFTRRTNCTAVNIVGRTSAKFTKIVNNPFCGELQNLVQLRVDVRFINHTSSQVVLCTSRPNIQLLPS